MLKFGKGVVRARVPILIVCLLLLIPSVMGMLATRINYDMLDYLPSDMETMQGQDILMKDFGKGAFSFVIVEGMSDRDVAKLEASIEQVPHVDTVLWYDDLMDLSVPKEILPEKYYNAFNSGDATMMAVFFDSSTSSDDTMEAVSTIRSIAGKQCFVSGMSALVTDLKDLCEREEPIYVGLAVICSCVVMMLLLDSWLVPLLFLASIGVTIVYNLGTNVFLGEISYITKALAAVLQLAVTMDYSIFLWHSFTEQKAIYSDPKDAMARAVAMTLTSVTGSSITTIAGFVAMCFMSYTMGMDLGIVMAKGVLLGVLGSVTLLPSLILLLDKPLEKTRHRALIPSMDKFAGWVTRHSWIFLIVFLVVLVPAVYGYSNTPVYYNFTSTLSAGDNGEDLQCLIADSKLNEYFDVSSTHMILCDENMPPKQAKAMLDEIEQVDGVKYALGLDSVIGSRIPQEIVPKEVTSILKNGGHQLMLINSAYTVATDECNAQIDAINAILKKYDPNGMLIGEGPCTKDLIQVTDRDFTVVSWISIAAIFVIILLVFKSISLPIILVSVIEFAIFINLGIPYYTGVTLPFIAPIAISTIQLGATVDYAILMTTRYKFERSNGRDKAESVRIALSSAIPSILVSALGFFAATFGVSIYSDVELISSLCTLLARGAIVSMLCVIFILPAMLMLLDKIIIHTGFGFKSRKTSDIGGENS